MIVPWQEVNPDSLQNLLEEFVTRDGTDYGEREISQAARVEQVMAQLRNKEVVIWFDQVTETVTLVYAAEARLFAEAE